MGTVYKLCKKYGGFLSGIFASTRQVSVCTFMFDLIKCFVHLCNTALVVLYCAWKEVGRFGCW